MVAVTNPKKTTKSPPWKRNGTTFGGRLKSSRGRWRKVAKKMTRCAISTHFCNVYFYHLRQYVYCKPNSTSDDIAFYCNFLNLECISKLLHMCWKQVGKIVSESIPVQKRMRMVLAAKGQRWGRKKNWRRKRSRTTCFASSTKNRPKPKRPNKPRSSPRRAPRRVRHRRWQCWPSFNRSWATCKTTRSGH